jgi:acetyl-CoA carboxylase biotin carboxylase subunit
MIKSILIANRGEIAIRIARTARLLGIRTYAIRTVKEPTAVYLSEVDEVVDFPQTEGRIPEFLDAETIVELARAKGIEAVHPGYGYLSENADFAGRCRQAGILFVGPSPEVISAMGDKITAKSIAERCGIPMLGGSRGSVTDVEQAVIVASRIGYPVIIKAAAGGGGRGMRIVREEANMQPQFQMASSEALNAFNDSSVFIEKYLENPKHIEIQIVADNFGNVVHLGERECSIQRKHQKLLEEAPSSALDDTLRDKMAQAAIRLAKEVGYQSLGTVEFLLDKERNFFFMEMNTRIQVEHPVTEMITGLDLVELQLLIVSGEKLPIRQADVQLTGWAIECRINAEDVQADFAPFLGTIGSIRLPRGENIRVDTGVQSGSEITPWFDSMIAKLIVHGSNRAQAIHEALKALQQFHIRGIKTTIPFCKAVLHHSSFQSGDFDTSFIETELQSMVYREDSEELLAALLAVYRHNHEITPLLESGVAIDPWVLNKRIRHL